MTATLARYTVFRLKEKCLRYSYTIQYCPGKWHKGADAVSCNPLATVVALISLCPTHPSSKDVHLSDNIDATTELANIQATMNTGDNNTTMTPDHIQALGWNDQSYTNLINSINQGFPSKCFLTKPDICNFWEVQHQLNIDRSLVLIDGRIIIPKSLRKKVLHCLYSAHQGTDGMKACTRDTVYWAGMNVSIYNFRENCSICARGIIVIVVGNEHGDMSSNPGRNWLHFT